MSPLSGKNKYRVFEFNKDDDRVEKFAKKVIGKSVYPRKNQKQRSPVDKYKFLQCFAQGTNPQQKTTGSEVVDIGAGGAYGAKFEHADSNEPTDVDAEVAQGAKVQQKETFEKLSDVDDNIMSNQCSCSVPYAMDISREDGAFREVAGSNYFNYGNKQVGVILDDDDSIEMSSPMTSSSSLSDNGGTSAISVSSEEQVAEHGFCEHEIDNVNKMVVVIPDYIIYKGNFCKESRISFSCKTIKVQGSTINDSKETFSFEWTTGDIINIQSGWFGSIETVVVRISHKSKDSTSDQIANEISVCDLRWPEKQEAIKSLDVRYKDKWNDFFDPDTDYEESAFLSQKSKLLSEQFSFEFDEPFEVIYPKGDPDAIVISKRDVELLAPGTFINDTIIDFYIKYLKNKIQPEEQHRFHFFNSFFFRKLADLDKDRSSSCEGRAAFQRIRKWTRKTDLFEKDYIFIPINYSLHWSLIVICHPGEVAYFKDDEIEKSLKVPCILHMDSIKGSHRGLKNLIQSYLCEEWKERHGNREDEVPLKFLRLLFVPLELPQQENSFDCGLFLLHYAELFLEEVPSNFNPFKITEFSNFLNRNWFPPVEASMKRARIKKLIYEICEDSSRKEDPLADCIDELPSSQSVTDENGKETQVFLGKTWSPTIAGKQGFTSISDAKKGIEISSSRASPQRDAHCTRDPFIFSQPGTSPRSSFNIRYEHVTARHQKSIMSPIEEAEENGEQIDKSPYNVKHFQQAIILAAESPTSSYVGGDCGVWQKKYCDHRFSRHFVVLDESTKECQSSPEEKLDKDQPLAEYEGFDCPETTDIPEEEDGGITAVVVEDSQEEDEGITAAVVEDSQEEDDVIIAVVVEDSQEEDGSSVAVIEDSEEENSMQDTKRNKDPSSSRGDTCILSHQKHTETIFLDENIMPISNEVMVLKADEHQGVKKSRRLLPKDRKLLKERTRDLPKVLLP